MSIREFHSRLTSCAQTQSRFMSALRKMSQTENPRELVQKAEALEPWQIWADGEEGLAAVAHRA